MTNPWTLARRAEKMNPSVIREILKVTEKPGIISFAGGLPSPRTFPVSAFSEACAKVLREDGQAALQYAASEGYGPLREAVASQLPWLVDPAQVLITTGSQQGLDLVAKVLVDAGSRILVETPTYLGALQAFTPMEPEVVSVDSDAEGVDVDDVAAKAGTGASRARFLYVLPNFQNPTGRTMSEARRAALVNCAAAQGLPLLQGQADLRRETQDVRVHVVPNFDAAGAALATMAINPAIGLGTLFAQWALREPLIAANTRELHITGPWAEPNVQRIERGVVAPTEKRPPG